MKTMILVGSGTRDSRSLHLGKVIETTWKQRSVEPETIDLLTPALPAFNVDTDRSKDYDKKTGEFLDISSKMDAFVWITPVHHGSYSSLLQNALGWQHFFGP